MIPFNRNKFIPGMNSLVPTANPQLKRNPFVMTANQPLPAPVPAGMPNPFGFEPHLPAQRNPFFAPTIDTKISPTDAKDQQFNFADEYSKIAGNRPNRLAYQQAVEEGTPEISRGKWAKLGAALAAGGSALGGTPAPQAANLGISAYMQPQERATANYERKIKGLEKLSNFEDQDIAGKIGALESQRGEFWKSKDYDLKVQGERRADDVAAADIRTKILARLRPIEKTDGNTYMYDMETGQEKLVGKTGFTPDETLDQAKRTLTMELITKDPYLQKIFDREQRGRERITGMEQAGANARNTADIKSAEAINQNTVQGRETVAGIQAEAKKSAAASSLRNRASTMKPDDIRRDITLNMADEIDAGTLSPDARAYLKFDENGMPYADKGYFGDDKVADELTAFIARSIRKSRGGDIPAPNRTGAGTTSTGKKYTITPVK